MKKKVTVDLRIGDDLLIVENVPATVCSHCGERVFTPEVTRKLQALAKQRKNHRAPWQFQFLPWEKPLYKTLF